MIRSAGFHHVLAERRNPAAGVDQDRHAALLGDLEQVADLRVVEREPLGARVQLDATSAGVEGPPCLPGGIVVRVHAAERHEPPAAALGLRKHAVVGLRVAVRLVHREEDGPAADPVEHLGELLEARLHAVGIVGAGVRMDVEQLDVAEPVAERGVEPRPQ